MNAKLNDPEAAAAAERAIKLSEAEEDALELDLDNRNKRIDDETEEDAILADMGNLGDKMNSMELGGRRRRSSRKRRKQKKPKEEDPLKSEEVPESEEDPDEGVKPNCPNPPSNSETDYS